jgi:hypothetical protein
VSIAVRPFVLFVYVFHFGLARGIIESRGVEVKKLLLVILAILFAGLVLIGLIDTVVSIPNASVSARELTNNTSKASNSSASATITITMYATADG